MSNKLLFPELKVENRKISAGVRGRGRGKRALERGKSRDFFWSL